VQDFDKTIAPNLSRYSVDGSAYILLQMQDVNQQIQRSALSALGVHFLQYLPENTWWVSLPSTVTQKDLQTNGVVAVILPDGHFKLEESLSQKNFPASAVHKEEALT
jgi:hypothetical protein